MFPHSLSPRSIAQLPSVHWPEVMATHVDPIPLSDTPPPLPAKKHRRQQQVTDSKLITWDYFILFAFVMVATKLIYVSGLQSDKL